MKDIRDDLGTVLKTGKVVYGSKNTIAAMLLENPKLVLVSSNAPKETREQVAYYSRIAGTSYHVTSENSVNMGGICGKPFPVSVLGIMDEGDSGILSKFKK